MRIIPSRPGKFLITGILAIALLLNGAVAALPAAAAASQETAKPIAAAVATKTAGIDNSARAKMAEEIVRHLIAMDNDELAATLKLFRVRQFIKNSYISELSSADLMTGAVKGAVAAVNDPYSQYLDERMLKEFLIGTKGSFSGVGLVLGIKDKQITVIAPIEGTPAEQAGILSADFVVKINGQETKDMTLEEAVNMIRGPEGTEVTLTVGRAGQEARDYTIVRATIQLKTVSGKMLEDDIGYIRITMFSETTGADFAAKLQELEQQGMKAMILDLRNNPGGIIDECVKVAGHLVPAGPVVSVVNRAGKKQTSYSALQATKYPLVVLVNGGSASAAEIVAGAVQDTGVGTLVGTTTFGKGSVQSLVGLGDDTAIKLTTAKYLTPKDRPITTDGIEPDIIVELPADVREAGGDPQMDKAKEIIKTKM